MAGAGVGLEMAGVRRVFGERVVVEDFSLRVAAGEFVAVLGPSGCGKSTLLRLIARLDRPDGGELRVGVGASFATGFVFQEANLLPWRTVVENAALPLELMGVERAEREARAREGLAEVGLAEAVGLYPGQLSGGMKMRVSLARAMVTRPQLLLLDEPFAALDEITRFRLDGRLRELWGERGMTVVFVTHSITEAAFLADRAIVLTRRRCGIKLDRALDLPRERDEALRLGERMAGEVRVLMAAMEEEE